MSSPIKQITLKYYKGLPGRCLPLQIAAEMSENKIKCVRDDVTQAEWFSGTNKDRENFPLGELPVAVVEREDGSKTIVCETNALLVLFGTASKFEGSALWPTDPVDQARAVEILICMEQTMTGAPEHADDVPYIPTYGFPEDKRAEVRQTKTAPRVKFYLGHINSMIKPGQFLVGSKLSIIDIYVAGIFGLFTDPKMGGGFVTAADFPNVAALAGQTFGHPAVGAAMGKVMGQ